MTPPLLATRFTELFGLTTPIALAPMAMASGGALAAACANAGALGLLGGGYGDPDWIEAELRRASDLIQTDPFARLRLGCGFITWKLDQDRRALDRLLESEAPPRTIMLSFGDPRRYGPDIRSGGTRLICQVQTLAQVPMALEAGADVVCAQGGEAGGHGVSGSQNRGTFTLVPEIADFLASQSPDTLLLAAGGVADGRGLAAALMLGADGALVGSRLWASAESLAADGAKMQAVGASGDMSVRSPVFDIIRDIPWPAPYDFRALRNALHEKWGGRIEVLKADPSEARAEYQKGLKEGDYSRIHTPVGEGAGLIRAIDPAADIVCAMTREAIDRLGLAGRPGAKDA